MTRQMTKDASLEGKIVLTAPGMMAGDCCADHETPGHITTGPRRIGRAQLLALAAVPTVAILYLGWPWLVAAGAAPFILAVAPCAAMCALGMCAMGARISPAHGDRIAAAPRSQK